MGKKSKQPRKRQRRQPLRAARCSPAPPQGMSDEEFDELIERWNKACIVKYGKTVCTLFEEEEAESAQENAELSEQPPKKL